MNGLWCELKRSFHEINLSQMKEIRPEIWLTWTMAALKVKRKLTEPNSWPHAPVVNSQSTFYGPQPTCNVLRRFINTTVFVWLAGFCGATNNSHYLWENEGLTIHSSAKIDEIWHFMGMSWKLDEVVLQLLSWESFHTSHNFPWILSKEKY